MTPYYQDSAVTLYHGDCREILPEIDAASVLCDAPYGINAFSHRPISPLYGRRIAGDDDTSLRDWIIAWAGSRPTLIFGSQKQQQPEGTRTVLIWDKGGGTGFNGDNTLPWKSTYEVVFVIGEGFVGGRTRESVLRHSIPGFSREHPHEKPVSLIQALIKCLPGQIVDPCAGSGPTLQAAKNLGRRAIGIEIEERYCEIAARRLAQEVFHF